MINSSHKSLLESRIAKLEAAVNNKPYKSIAKALEKADDQLVEILAANEGNLEPKIEKLVSKAVKAIEAAMEEVEDYI